MNKMTRDELQKFSNEFDVKIHVHPDGNIWIGGSHISFIKPEIAEFEYDIYPKKPWHWPRATDADEGKECFVLDIEIKEEPSFLNYDWQRRIVRDSKTCYYNGCNKWTSKGEFAHWPIMVLPNPENIEEKPPEDWNKELEV